MTDKQNNMGTPGFFLLWFGAAVSIAEISTGGLLASMGFSRGLAAIIAGHVLGVSIMVLGGIIGTKERIPAIQSTAISFGSYGPVFFSVFNILQLIGWTAVMIIWGGGAINDITTSLWNLDMAWLWNIVIGALICLWIVMGTKGWKRLNSVAVSLLLLLTVWLGYKIFSHPAVFSSTAGSDPIGIGNALELNVVMPLSWLPLIADYTRFAKSGRAGALGSWLGYFTGSSWMYIIGLGGAIVAGSADPGMIISIGKLGIIALAILFISTVTTTFMDAYSAGVTSLNIFKKFNEKSAAIITALVGTGIALVVDIRQYENFLYAIGSLFAPLFAVLLTDYFILKNRKARQVKIRWTSAASWATGVVLYHVFLRTGFIGGATLPVMVVTGALFVLLSRINPKAGRDE